MFLHTGVQVLPPLCAPVFPTSHTVTFLHRSCLSQNPNSFNTLLEECTDGPEEHEASCQQGPKTTTATTWGGFSKHLTQTTAAPELPTSWDHLSWKEQTESLTDAQNANHDQGRNHTNKQKCSHQWHLLLQTRGMGRALVHPCTSLQPTLLFQSPSIKATGFFPSLLGECGDPIFTPSNSGGITSVMLHTCNRTRASLLPAINSACLFLFKQNFS